MGRESTIDALSFACQSSCRVDTGPRKSQQQPHDGHRFARRVDRAAGGAEQAAGWAAAVGDSRACAPRCPRGTGLKSALSSLPAVND